MAWAGTKALVSVENDRAVTSGKRIGKRSRSAPINTMTFVDFFTIQSIVLDI
jgi:hypothetical protein